jgi:alpha-tubulin suppressor-like RCC1 family protein
VSAGYWHTAAIRSDGSLWAWGSNTYGELGKGSTGGEHFAPAQVDTANDWKVVSAGQNFTAAIKTNGTLWTCGYNSYGQLGHGSTGTGGNLAVLTQVGSWTDWVVVECAPNHAVGLRADGTLWAWGNNPSGQLGDGSITIRNAPVQVGLTVGLATGWATVSAGDNWTAAIRTDGSLYTWGNGAQGRHGLGDTTNRNVPTRVDMATDWVAVSCGAYHGAALKDYGAIYAWGYSNAGQVGDGTNTQRNSPVQVGAAEDWVALSVGGNHTAAMKGDGSLWVWGQNSLGQIGDGATGAANNRPSPVMVDTGFRVPAN